MGLKFIRIVLNAFMASTSGALQQLQAEAVKDSGVVFFCVKKMFDQRSVFWY